MLLPIWQHPSYRHQENHLRLINPEKTSPLKDAGVDTIIALDSNFICPLTNQSLSECNCIKSALKPHDLCLFCPAARMHLKTAM
jgi:hypothetical protein